MNDERIIETVLDRAANQAARAVVQVIEEHTGKPVSMYNSGRLLMCIGATLELTGIEGGPPGEIRAILEQEWKPTTEKEVRSERL